LSDFRADFDVAAAEIAMRIAATNASRAVQWLMYIAD
jgi:hypothetical protein